MSAWQGTSTLSQGCPRGNQALAKAWLHPSRMPGEGFFTEVSLTPQPSERDKGTWQLLSAAAAQGLAAAVLTLCSRAAQARVQGSPPCIAEWSWDFSPEAGSTHSTQPSHDRQSAQTPQPPPAPLAMRAVGTPSQAGKGL